MELTEQYPVDYDDEIDRQIIENEAANLQNEEAGEEEIPEEITVEFANNCFQNWKEEQKQNIQSYQKNNSKYKDDIYRLNGTTKSIHYKEIQFLREKLSIIQNIHKPQKENVLNIPSGSGRLNRLLHQYFTTISCADACQESLQTIKDTVKKQKLKYVSLIFQEYIQTFCQSDEKEIQKIQCHNQFDAIFCNYGISYLDITQLKDFFKTLYYSSLLKPKGLLIIKEVYLGHISSKPKILKQSKRILLSQLQYRDIIFEANKYFTVESEDVFVPSLDQYPEKFIVFKKKQE